MFNVSTKTISRWREQGLVSRRFLFDGKRKRVGFLRSSVERFVAHNAERVRRGERFSQLTDEERREMIERARRLVAPAVARRRLPGRVAQHMNRSIETVRYTLKQFDKQHPEQAVFPEQTGVLTEEVKKKIYQQIAARRIGRFAGPAVLPHADDDLSRAQRDAGPADPGAAAGLHVSRELRQGGHREGHSRPDARRAERRRRCAAPADCRRIWRPCTKCRC